MSKSIEHHINRAVDRILAEQPTREARGTALYEFTLNVLYTMRFQDVIVPAHEDDEPPLMWEVEPAKNIVDALRARGE